MSEFKGLDMMVLPTQGQRPDWVQEWGEEVYESRRLLNYLYGATDEWPMQERNSLFKFVKEDLITIRQRWHDAWLAEMDEAVALCNKYNAPEVGVFDLLLKESQTFMTRLEARFPSMVPVVKDHDESYPFMVKSSGKYLGGHFGRPMITFRYGGKFNDQQMALKGLQAVADRRYKQASLQKEQIQVLARALEGSGMELPQEFAAIQEQLDALERSTDMPAQTEDAETGERVDPCPDAQPVALLEDSDRRAVTVVFENRAEPYIRPPEPMWVDQVQKLLEDMSEDDFSKMFHNPPTEEEAPGYFDVVKQHRDLGVIQRNMMTIGGYIPHGGFFRDMRLMIDNYCFVFGEGSPQYENALKFEEKLLQRLETYGERGQTAKTQFNEAPRANFDEASELSEDGGIVYDSTPPRQLEADDQNDNTVDADDTRQPGGSPPDQSPSSRLDDDEAGDQIVGDVTISHGLPFGNPESDGMAPPPEAAASETDDDNTFNISHAENPFFSDPAASPEATAGEAGEDNVHAGAHGSHQTAPIALVEEEQSVIDLTSSPPGHTSLTGSASAKRARASDDQESSDDDAPLLRKRRKTAVKTPTYTATPSLGKRSRDDGDDDDEEERGQPSKRQRSSSPSAQGPLPTVAAAANDHDFSEEAYTNSLSRVHTALQQQRQLALQQDPGLQPSPAFEPLTPEPANHGSPSVAADDLQPAPATTALGHTNNGTITATQLHKLPKYKKKARTKGLGIPSRPWVFGHRFGNDYGLYIMGCPTKGCDTGPEIFKTHPLMFRNDAAAHLEECCGDFGADDDDMVRKFCKQVISDDKKAVSIEWARNWNNQLMQEYGDEDRQDENF